MSALCMVRVIRCVALCKFYFTFFVKVRSLRSRYHGFVRGTVPSYCANLHLPTVAPPFIEHCRRLCSRERYLPSVVYRLIERSHGNGSILILKGGLPLHSPKTISFFIQLVLVSAKTGTTKVPVLPAVPGAGWI